MCKLIILVLFLGLQVSCDSDSEPEISCANSLSHATQDLSYIIPSYTYATENTNNACYTHALQVINDLEASDNSDGFFSNCEFTALPSYPNHKKYRIDEIEEKFVNDFENLNAIEVEELTNLICGREFGNESFRIDSLDNFEIINSQLHVLYTIGEIQQTKVISSHIDEKFNCPLYQFHCSDIFTAQKE